MNPQTIALLVDLGLRLAVKAIEKRAEKRVDSMTDEEVLRAINSISVRPVDELIEEGRKRVEVEGPSQGEAEEEGEAEG